MLQSTGKNGTFEAGSRKSVKYLSDLSLCLLDYEVSPIRLHENSFSLFWTVHCFTKKLLIDKKTGIEHKYFDRWRRWEIPEWTLPVYYRVQPSKKKITKGTNTNTSKQTLRLIY